MRYRPHDGRLTATAFVAICGSLAFANRDSDTDQDFAVIAAQSGAYAIAADLAFAPLRVTGPLMLYAAMGSAAWAGSLGALGDDQANYAPIAGSIRELATAVNAYVMERDPTDALFGYALMGALAGAYLFERYTIRDQAGWSELISKTAPFAEAIRAAFPLIPPDVGTILVSLCMMTCQGRTFSGAPISAYTQTAAGIAETTLDIFAATPPDSPKHLVSGCFMVGCAGQYAQTQPSRLGADVSAQALALANAIEAAYPAVAPMGIELGIVYQNLPPNAAASILALRQGGPVADWTPTAAKVAELYSAMIAWWNANINAGPS